ncbi:WecB/TagA/CpsF family glycosyltransferase [Bradyrhizobium sp. GCM10023182]|uniref:WecB/TagA/CpsF family glycosyltransferase n=1 Tax=Bradyrhizobium zhengyangense TaxID=2911009 RepID=A0ABS9M2B9_9BRAD|nr:WecB/TagA/CpsF family glycosyltransferase [Bradyrhizobium zhengyangense]MCG2673301.1 WecB/TagA/CpsF family glycosyltransferase [Bradyrhizobium zhengyangense]
MNAASAADHDDLARRVYGLMGVPVDAIDFPTLLRTMIEAADASWPFLISTPNVNFLVKSQSNAAFRESILASDLCLIDGMPLIWIAKLLRIPILERLAGSDLFGRLKSRRDTGRRLRVFLFGGNGDLVERVGAKLNWANGGMECVGALNPGFGTVEEMSSPQIIGAINASQADLLAVFLGAEKAQSWLIHNHASLSPPLRAQFGATINFEAGTVRRAPPLLRSTGFEWLWRIKEEPYLWRRYLSDGVTLLRLLVTSVLPGVARLRRQGGSLSVLVEENLSSVTLRFAGAATEANAGTAVKQFRVALEADKDLKVDLAAADIIDPRFFGLFLMVRKTILRRGRTLQFVGVSRRLRRLFRLNRFEYLLPADI